MVGSSIKNHDDTTLHQLSRELYDEIGISGLDAVIATGGDLQLKSF